MISKFNGRFSTTHNFGKSSKNEQIVKNLIIFILN